MKDAKELLKPADVAPLLGVTTGRVYQLIAERIIPAVRIAGALRIPRSAWDEWLREQCDEALQSLAENGRTRPTRRDVAAPVGSMSGDGRKA